jgi:hypothetical protein
MATITIKIEREITLSFLGDLSFRGIGAIEDGGLLNPTTIQLVIPRMSETRFENVVKRVLTKNLTEQGITPLSIEYNDKWHSA